MLCPSCKKEIPDNSLKCTECGTRVGRLCPNCRTYNILTAKKCIKCEYNLLKTCPNCGATNASNAATCRKCGASMNQKAKKSDDSAKGEKKIAVIDAMPKYEAVYYSQNNAKEKIKEGILNSDIKIIGITGESGSGKDIIIKFVSAELKDKNYVWLTGKCTKHTKYTPCGFIQDVLLTLLNMNDFCIDIENLKKDSLKFFKQEFPNMTPNEVYDFINFLYPEKYGEFKNIHANKQNTFNILFNIFKTIITNSQIILVVDNIQDIDSMSLEFLNKLINNEEARENITIIVMTSEERSAQIYFPNDNLTDSTYDNIAIAPLSREQLIPIMDKYKNLDLNIEQKNLIHKYSNGNPANFEQYINLTADKLRNAIPFSVPQTIEDVIKERLDIFKEEDILAYKVLTAISILGYKSNPIILNTFCDVDIDQLGMILKKLTKLNYLVEASDTVYEFKSTYLWKLIHNTLKQNTAIYKTVCDELIILLQNYHLSSYASMCAIAKDMKYVQQYLSIGTTIMQTASYIGDTNLFVTAQKQILNIVENNTIESADTIKKNIYFQCGKLLESTNPEEAITFLTKALHTEDITVYEEIDLLGYIASCAMKTNNYYGVIECVDSVLSKLDNPDSLDAMVIKSRKLRALNKVGNFGEVVTLAENEIIPAIESALSKKSYKYKLISEDEVFETWLNVLFELIKALTRQGNDKAFKVSSELFKILEANNIHDKQFFCNIQLELALANTIKGRVKTSNKILQDIFDIYQNSDVINSNVVSRLNLISLLNKFFTERSKIEMEELFNIAEFADNIGDKLTKNISKLVLGKIILQTQSAQSAIDIYKKQLEYFAREKNAVGVLLGWYLTAEATMLFDKQQALDIAHRALNIAQKPEICNHYFTLLFEKLICKIYISSKDYESARIHCDKALTIAKGYDIQYQLAKLYIIAGDCQKEMVETSTDKKSCVDNAIQLYNLAKNIGKNLEIASLERIVLQKMNEVEVLCQAKGIII